MQPIAILEEFKIEKGRKAGVLFTPLKVAGHIEKFCREPVFFIPVLSQRICFFIFATAQKGIRFPVIPVSLAVEEPGILDGKYGPPDADYSGEAKHCKKSF